MTDNEKQIRAIFGSLTARRAWYSHTSINRTQAFEIKKRYLSGDLSFGRIVEILHECGYAITVEKHT